MNMQQACMFSVVAIVLIVILAEQAESCSCRSPHPQEHFCNADFVVLARIKRQRTGNDTIVYKIRIRKDYKLSEKAYVALKSGRIITPRAHVNMCGYAEKWENITRRQRKGLRKMYGYGCTCKIKKCSSQHCPKNVNTCNWTSSCHVEEGICLRQANNHCNWTRNAALSKCLRNKTESLTISRWSG